MKKIAWFSHSMTIVAAEKAPFCAPLWLIRDPIQEAFASSSPFLHRRDHTGLLSESLNPVLTPIVSSFEGPPALLIQTFPFFFAVRIAHVDEVVFENRVGIPNKDE